MLYLSYFILIEIIGRENEDYKHRLYPQSHGGV